MNRILIVIGLFTLVFTISCEKNRTCGCTSNYSGADTTWTSTHKIMVEKSTRKLAKVTYASNNKTTTLLSETLVIDCSLD